MDSEAIAIIAHSPLIANNTCGLIGRRGAMAFNYPKI
jgi:hypothetical protein